MSQSISISQIQDVLIATIQVDLSVMVVNEFRTQLLERVSQHTIQGVLIDLSEVKTLDRMDIDALVDVVATVNVMGRRCVFVGIRPGIAMALVNINYDTDQLTCVRSIDDGLAVVGG
ncbi:STAS domain-containing protein [Vibrio atypicus]|jgi:rsbT antagonist protein RsbS|uniref:STAS domain-containing protein n=1 Tax=Vibrio atypicus TaxID=558271 RepID=UPI00135C6C70|nr:STAS domain-containing protein [Vibrio atypicus]